jgi:hypothetical protein
MKQHMVNQVWVDEFSSLAETLAYAKANTKRLSSDKRTDNKWSGSESLDAAVDLGMVGWHEVRPEVDRMVDQMNEHINMALGDVFQTVMNYEGDSVDMDRYLMNDPECMMDYEMVPSGRMGRVVRVLVNGSCSWRVDSDTIKARGALACALVDTLAKLGVGVEVWLEMATKHRGLHSALIMLHSSEERLDIDNLMFAMAHPSMLRRISFSLMEQTQWPDAKQIIGHGYGQPHDLLMGDYVRADVKVDKLENATGDPIQDGVKYILSTVSGLQLV